MMHKQDLYRVNVYVYNRMYTYTIVKEEVSFQSSCFENDVKQYPRGDCHKAVIVA